MILDRCILGDCRDVMRGMPPNSVDAIVTDPPYGLTSQRNGRSPATKGAVMRGFMGLEWDGTVPGVEFWELALQVAKPGAHLVAFGGTRSFHRLACAIEDAGWELRDSIGYAHASGEEGDCPWLSAWVYGSGFPKSKNLDGDWKGWGSALKPAWEPIILARKPLIGTMAESVLAFGTGVLNIDASRIPTDPSVDDPRLGGAGTWSSDKMAKNVYEGGYAGERVGSSPLGRWPANLIHDGSEEVVALFPDSNGQLAKASTSDTQRAGQNCYGAMTRGSNGQEPRNDTGSAARFFYSPKATRRDRNEGCESLPKESLNWSSGGQSPGTFQSHGTDRRAANHHPTVKPTELMRYLCRLVTPPGGVILDPFAGSGSTAKAAILEGFRVVAIEREDKYIPIINARMIWARSLADEVTKATAAQRGFDFGEAAA